MQTQWSSFAEFWASTRVSTWAPGGATLGDERSQLSRHDLGIDDLVIVAFTCRHEGGEVEVTHELHKIGRFKWHLGLGVGNTHEAAYAGMEQDLRSMGAPLPRFS